MLLGETTGPAAAVWAQDHPVLEVLRQRKAQASVPGHRNDGHRVALAVEGGGLRGVVSAAMLTALEDLGYKDVFDVIYACSSGAINAAYFIVGETWYPTSIYFEDLVSKEFLDFRRVFRRQSIMNLPFAMDEIVGRKKPLDYPAVLASPIPFHIMITDVDAMTTRAPSEFHSQQDLYQALQASMWLPLAARGTARFRDYNAIDGGVLTAHPFMVAEADETVTHVLSLSTRPMGRMRASTSAMNRFVGFRLDRTRKGLGSRYVEAVRTYKAARSRVEAERTRPARSPAVLDLAPLPQRAEVIRHESSSWLLLEGARTGYEVIYAALEGVWRRPMLRLVVPDHNRPSFPYRTWSDGDT